MKCASGNHTLPEHDSGGQFAAAVAAGAACAASSSTAAVQMCPEKEERGSCAACQPVLLSCTLPSLQSASDMAALFLKVSKILARMFYLSQ